MKGFSVRATSNELKGPGTPACGKRKGGMAPESGGAGKSHGVMLVTATLTSATDTSRNALRLSVRSKSMWLRALYRLTGALRGWSP